MKLDILNGMDPGGDDRAVSPVVGVALLIAITVILAAVIGFVVLNESTSTTDAPNARLNFNLQENTTIHEGGDTFNATNVVVRVGGNEDELTEFNGFTTGDRFKTGDTVDLTTGTDVTGVPPGETVTFVWDDPDSDREVNLGQATAE